MTHPADEPIAHLTRQIAHLLGDSGTEDTAIIPPGDVWAYQDGRWVRQSIFLDYKTLESIAVLAGSYRRQEIGEDTPILDEMLPNDVRLSAILPPIVDTETASLVFRNHERRVSPLESVPDRYHTQGWNQWSDEDRAARDLSKSMAAFQRGNIVEFLRACILEHLNIIFVGATGLGKTTFGRTCIAAMDRGERIITIEDSEELAGLPPNNVRLKYSHGSLSQNSIGHKELLEAAMRQRPDRIIVGEMRDDAVVTWIMKACTGHPGSLTTIHGSSARDAVRRIAQLMKTSDIGARLDVADTLASTIDVIVPLYKTDPDETGKSRGIGSVWYIGDAQRRGETIANLLG